MGIHKKMSHTESSTDVGFAIHYERLAKTIEDEVELPTGTCRWTPVPHLPDGREVPTSMDIWLNGDKCDPHSKGPIFCHDGHRECIRYEFKVPANAELDDHIFCVLIYPILKNVRWYWAEK